LRGRVVQDDIATHLERHLAAVEYEEVRWLGGTIARRCEEREEQEE
jgi:hypothetical protein